MIWWVHRNAAGAICFAAQYEQSDYAQEQLDDTTSAELQAFLAVAFKVMPPKPTPLAWFQRLSQTTQANLAVAARTDVQVDLVMRYASGASNGIDVADPLTIQSVQMLQAKGLLTQAEANALLAP